MEVFERNNDPKASSHWLPLFLGKITACGAPSRTRFRDWPDRGVTDVVCLLRADEMADWVAKSAERLGLRLHHYPLSGRHLSQPEDSQTLARFPELLNLLRDEPRGVVVHCAAGMHRTGVFLYHCLRHAGFAPLEAIERVCSARALTGGELLRRTQRGVLADKAEALYQDVLRSVS